MITRRSFLASSLALSALPVIGRAQTPSSAFAHLNEQELRRDKSTIFRHGVASGDPLSNRVVLWTRLTMPALQTGTVDVEWMIGRDPRMSRVVGRGAARTSAERDFTVKVDAAGLEPGATYYYRFVAQGQRSPLGRTRTLPLRQVRRVRLALASCANHPFGYFNVYARIAERSDLDAVLHLGDYIYEYANNNFGNRPAGDGRPFNRVPNPDRELLALDDYRARYAQYREDADLQAAHRQHPFIVIWDDHEIANNAWSGGAQNHNADRNEGEWHARKRAAIRAWQEWMPVRESPGVDYRLYRRFSFGDLADLFMLDTRITGRDEQARAREDIATTELKSRHVLGTAQEEWLFGSLEDSVRAGRPWQMLGQQVMFAPQTPPGQPAGNVDSWDGYRAARNRVFDAAAASRTNHLVVLTGDVHSSWAYDLARDPFDAAKYDPTTGRGAIGCEIVAPAVTSPTPAGWTTERGAAVMAARPHARFVEGLHRGFVVLDITRERLQADWWFVPSVTEPSSVAACARSLATEAKRPHLVDADGPLRTTDAVDPAP